MNLLKSIQAKQPSEDPLGRVSNNALTHLTNLVQGHNNTMKNFFFNSILQSSSRLHQHVFGNIQAHLKRNPFSPNRSPPLWASTSHDDQFDKNMHDDDQCKKNNHVSKKIKQLLNEIPVYRMTEYTPLPQPILTSNDESAVFYFFNEQDAEALVRSRNKRLKKENRELRVIKVPLAEIIDNWGLNFVRWLMPGITATRLVPDMSEVKNALEEKSKAGTHGDSFSGVPVFQSDALRIMVDGLPNYGGPFLKTRRPVFFKKADLIKALRDVKEFNQRDIQVTSLEDIIQEMKDFSTSKLDDVAFIPPGGALGGAHLHTSWKWEILRMAAYLFLTFS